MKKTFWITLITLLIVILGMYSHYIEPNKLNIVNYTIEDAALSGLKIVFASDFHVRDMERLDKVVKLINEENPDFVLSVGDFVEGHKFNHAAVAIEDIAKKLTEINSKYGFYTSFGNHETWYSKERAINALTAENIVVLLNNNTYIDINGKKVYIAGIEDELTEHPDITAALEGTENPVILLTHSPDVFPDVPESVNLTLAGHTHGGQIRIPLLGPIYTASKYYDKYAQGLIVENNKKMIVTRGVGYSILPFRFNCPPEIVVIEFK
ncbi:metallophosphoesterase [bacterium]|nr:metallophosphoesterase [bacterium]